MATPGVTKQDIVKITIELIAAEQDRDPEDLFAELQATGLDLPIDSLLIMEVLTQVESHCGGVQIGADNAAAWSLRSVHTFADTVLAAVVTAQNMQQNKQEA